MRKLGDRKDGALLRNLDAMHFMTPHLYPNRCDNEAFVSETIDLSKAKAFLRSKNDGLTDNYYSLFQIIVTAMLKMITLRPKMNRFVANKNIYQRNKVTGAFVVKSEYDDDADEGLALVEAKPTDNLETIHNEMIRQVTLIKNKVPDPSTKVMEIITKIPRFISRTFISIMHFFDKRGLVPQAFIATDPYYATVLFSNVGSVRLHAGYHHLTNWGTNSIFMMIGEKKKRPFFKLDGTADMKDSIDLGLTVDERIADGYYFAKSIRLLRKLIENPELLDMPLGEEVKY